MPRRIANKGGNGLAHYGTAVLIRKVRRVKKDSNPIDFRIIKFAIWLQYHSVNLTLLFGSAIQYSIAIAKRVHRSIIKNNYNFSTFLKSFAFSEGI
jgi:hypothetical protein